MTVAESWILGAIGAWILLSPWIFGFSDITLAKWSNVFFGIVLVIAGTRNVFNKKI